MCIIGKDLQGLLHAMLHHLFRPVRISQNTLHLQSSRLWTSQPRYTPCIFLSSCLSSQIHGWSQRRSHFRHLRLLRSLRPFGFGSQGCSSNV